MEDFLRRNGHVQVKFSLNQAGLTDDNFFTTEATHLYTVLQGYEKLDSFLSAFIKSLSQKSVDTSKNESITSSAAIDLNSDKVDKQNIVSSADNSDEEGSPENKSHTNSATDASPNVFMSSDGISENSVNKLSEDIDEDNTIKTKVLKDFQFIQNDLYHFLNDDKNMDGRIILGKYKELGELDMSRLKRVLVSAKLAEDSVNFKIASSVFEKWYKEFLELFPTVDRTLFYSPYKYLPNGLSIGASGAIYNHYKCERHQLKLAGLLKSGKNDHVAEATRNTSSIHPWKKLTDEDRSLYTENEVLSAWSESYDKRLQLIIPPAQSREKAATTETYINTFKCLCPPLGITLLETDYNNLMEQKIGDELYQRKSYKTIIASNWPAQKIIDIVQNNNTKDCKAFAAKLKNIVIEESNINSISLLALPWCIKNAPKTVKVEARGENTDEIVIIHKILSKSEVCNCFILHIEDGNNLLEKRLEHEQWLENLKQPPLPYVIFCGPVSRISQIYVVLNNHLYLFENSVLAIEACFKCYIALNKWPNFSEFVWNAIEKGICKWPATRNIKASTDFVSILSGATSIVPIKIPVLKRKHMPKK